MSVRITTNGTLHSYKSNLMRSQKTLNDASKTVLTQRKFNSYAEDPAAASQAFQLRRSMWRTESQITNNRAVTQTYNTAWEAVDSVANDIGNELASASALRGLSDASASGRQALGQTILSAADTVVQTMNIQYGENYVFAGADGLNVPLTWDDDGKTLLYRGIPVDSAQGTADGTVLKTMEGETTYVDLGLGLDEDSSGTLIKSSAFSSSLSALTFLGYGTDEDGDPKNIVSLMKQLGDIFSNCDESGNFASTADETDANRLTDKLKSALSNMNVKYTELDTKATFLKTNGSRLDSKKDTINEQIVSIEQANEADAISDLSWAQYCYNAALKIGNSIMSQSLLDYLDH